MMGTGEMKSFNRLSELHEGAEERERSSQIEKREYAQTAQDECVDGLTNDLIITLSKEYGWSRARACEEIRRFLK